MTIRITERPLYQRPNRALALEAAIVAALMVNGTSSAYQIARFVEQHLPWAGRLEIAQTRDRMIQANRVVAVRRLDSSSPWFALPEVAHAAHDAPASADRDIAHRLPA